MASDEHIQEKYMHLQIIAQTLKQVQQQLQMVEGQTGELEKVTEGLGELGKTKIGTGLLVPVYRNGGRDRAWTA